MRVFFGIFIVYFALSGISAQEGKWTMTPYDSVLLMKLPKLDKAPMLKSSDLPYVLDNSELPFFRPIYKQVASECSQVSAVAYNFTFEINRLRNLPSVDSVNQYPTHFVYNFDNRGSPWYGVSYHHSFEILKTLGTPDVPTYGGMAAGGAERWMNGYENYYAAMNNQIREAYQIPVGTEEGLLQLKHWLHNHLDGSEYGGVASFYANAPWNMKTLYEGTPEAGKKVIVNWEGLPTHAMTIIGYNDSIRWDYNWDGQYTNHIDINEDGIVDMKDWEIGGLFFADGWSHTINYGDSGKCYMMYATLAKLVYEGGIWNNVVHVLDVRESYEPRLTAKISLNHNMRNMIRVSIGVSSGTGDTGPQHEICFPVFNFQGGSQYMQGGTEIEENKTIEFGLDISPLLGLLDSNSLNTFYLLVDERDPDDEGEGYIEYFSVFDHTGGSSTEFISTEVPVPIKHHDRTSVSVIIPPALDIMQISTAGLPPAVVNEPYSYTLEAEGGDPPVEWNMLNAVEETEFHTEMGTAGTFMEPDNWDYGTVDHRLGFSFPFYGETYDSIFIHPAGFIMFEKSTNPWPYLVDLEFFIKENHCIAPLLCRFTEYIPAFGHGIWISEETDHTMISWVFRCIYPPYQPLLKFALKLFEDGQVKFIYGSDFNSHKLPWSCGISIGDQLNYYIPGRTKQDSILNGEAVSLECFSLPEGMDINADGVFSGTPGQPYDAPIMFCAGDDEHVRTYKALYFKASSLGLEEPGDALAGVQLYPNPFSDMLNIDIQGRQAGISRCVVLDIQGKVLRILRNGGHSQNTAGPIRWDGKDNRGKSVAPGLYLIYLRSGDKVLVKKAVKTSP